MLKKSSEREVVKASRISTDRDEGTLITASAGAAGMGQWRWTDAWASVHRVLAQQTSRRRPRRANQRAQRIGFARQQARESPWLRRWPSPRKKSPVLWLVRFCAGVRLFDLCSAGWLGGMRSTCIPFVEDESCTWKNV